ncbi:hypothetical protein [Streptomyces sp. NPDC050287]|uniref:hypothetical protein n=1 Tax=Streptomyces sp. NPDC050287 TaxID=3365608 RepID=UPI00379F7EB5
MARIVGIGGLVTGMAVLAACGGSSDGGSAGATSGSPSPSTSPSTSAGTGTGPTAVPTHTSAPPSASEPASPFPSPSGPATSATVPPSAPAPGRCAAGRTKVTVAPGDAPRQRLCVRPGTVVELVLRPRLDDKRWTAVRSSAPVFVLVSGWQVGADGTARASLRCAGTRAGTAGITALAKAPDVAGAARVAFTLDVSVVPYRKEG